MSDSPGFPAEHMDEIDRFYADNPNPSKQALAARLLPLAARRIIRNDAGYPVDDLHEFTGVVHDLFISDGLTLNQAASITIPAVYDLLDKQNRMLEMKAWMKACFFDQGLDREQAVKILKAHQEAAA